MTKIEIAKSNKRDRESVKIRRDIIMFLRKKGKTLKQIGRLLNKHHTSILYHIDDDFRYKKNFK